MKSIRVTIQLSVLLLLSMSQLMAQPTVLISYYSKTGNTQAMAEAVARGASKVEGITIVLKTVEETTNEDLLNAGAIILGSPVYNANVAPRVQEFISSWPFEGAPLKDKLGAAFVTAGGISAGEEVTLLNMLQSMMIFGMIVMGGDDWTAPFGASGIRGEPPFSGDEPLREAFLEKGEKMGARVAGVLLKMQP
ncbi:MAG: flavodoxin family protein [Bacteroidetes bacterium]|nr:MAG: flavodoxin family protein [Bacteroidota bacterium]